MNKLNITEDEVKNFAVAHIQHLEGCPIALTYLMNKFGSQVSDLTLHGDEIKHLIMNDRADWAINFMLNLLKPKYRLAFYEFQLDQALIQMKNTVVKDFIKNYFTTYSKKCTKRVHKDMIEQATLIKTNLSRDLLTTFNEANRNEIYFTLGVLESITFFLNDKDKKFTRHITDGLLKLAEAKVYLDFVQYPYEDNIQSTGLSLMEYLDLW